MTDINKVFIVDDDAAVRDALVGQMEAAGFDVSSFPSAAKFLDVCTPDTLGCIILDVSMPNMDGPTLQDELIRRNLKLPIIFLSGQGTIPLTVRTMKAGALDFLTKPVEGSLLRARVKDALELCSVLHNQSRASQAASARFAGLTEREREVMMLAIAGHTSKEIASLLDISFRTVETHRTRVIQKTGTSNMLELAQIVKLQESK